MSLETNVDVLPVTKCEPKRALEDLIRQSARSNQEHLEIFGDIAGLVNLSRCAHTKETGLQAFADEVKAELGPLLKTQA